MGIGSSLRKGFGGGLGGLGGAGGFFVGGIPGAIAGKAVGKELQSFLTPEQTSKLAEGPQEQLTAANVFSKLTPEQQKDMLINNPNIVTAQGKQFYDPLTNTIKLEESEFQSGQRGRQEQLAAELSGQLTGQTLPGTDPASRFESGRELLKPAFEEERSRLEQQLADQGIPRGSEAFAKELNRLEQSQGTRLQSVARESVATSEAQRAARFNEISSLLGQQQVGGTGFGDFNAQFQGSDVLGYSLGQQNLAQQAYQAKKDRDAQKRQALVGGLGQLGGSAIGLLSDKTLKENIKEVGKSKSGLTIYHFDYINKEHGEGRFEGVMAQDLLESNPQAIIHLGDKLAVDYDKIDVDFRRIV